MDNTGDNLPHNVPPAIVHILAPVPGNAFEGGGVKGQDDMLSFTRLSVIIICLFGSIKDTDWG